MMWKRAHSYQVKSPVQLVDLIIYLSLLTHSSTERTQTGQHPEGCLGEDPYGQYGHSTVQTKRHNATHTSGGGESQLGENAVWGAKVLFGSVIAFITGGAIDSEGEG